MFFQGQGRFDLILPLHTGLRGAHEGNGRWESERTANLWPKAHSNVVGIHYAFAGPTRPAWESASGSRVVAARTVAPVTVDTNAIPWLVLNAVPENTIGPGIFERTTYIQRVNTTGGSGAFFTTHSTGTGSACAIHRRILLLPGSKVVPFPLGV